MKKTLFLSPPSFEGFDGGAGSRYQARREIRSFWYPTWLAQPAALVPGSRLIDAPPHDTTVEETLRVAKDHDLVIIHTSTPSLPNDCKTAEEAIPRNITSDISVQGKAAPSSVFTYYQTNNAQFTPGNDVTYIKRIDVNIKVTSSAGSLKGEAASFAVSSGVDIKQYV